MVIMDEFSLYTQNDEALHVMMQMFESPTTEEEKSYKHIRVTEPNENLNILAGDFIEQTASNEYQTRSGLVLRRRMKLFLGAAMNRNSIHWGASSHRGGVVVRHFNKKEAIIYTGLQFANSNEYRVGSDTIYNPWSLSETVEWTEIKVSSLYLKHWQEKEPAILGKDCADEFCEHCNEDDEESLLYFRKVCDILRDAK